MGLLNNILPTVDPPKSNKIKVVDGRQVDVATGKKVSDTNKLSYEADPMLVNEIVSKSNKYGIDPYTALAMCHQETGYALPKPNKYFPDVIKASNPYIVGQNDEFPGGQKIGEWMQANPDANNIDAFMTLYKNKAERAQKMGKKDEASVIQGWNGYGKIPAGSYGSDSEIDMNSNPVYGKRIIDLRENVIKKNPEIVKMVQAYQKPSLPNITIAR